MVCAGDGHLYDFERNDFSLKKVMKKVFLLFLIFAVFAFTSCQKAMINDSVSAQSKVKTEIKQVSVEETNEAVKNGNVQFIDVRTAAEYESGHAPKSLNLPLNNLEAELAKLDKDKPVYLICQTGRRSQIGAEILQKADFKELYNVRGGTVAWVSAELLLEK